MKTLKQAAKDLGTTYEALRKKVQRKAIKAQKIGNQWFISNFVMKKLLEALEPTTEEKTIMPDSKKLYGKSLATGEYGWFETAEPPENTQTDWEKKVSVNQLGDVEELIAIWFEEHSVAATDKAMLVEQIVWLVEQAKKSGYNEALKAENLMPAFQKDKQEALSHQATEILEKTQKVVDLADDDIHGYGDPYVVMSNLQEALQKIKERFK